MSLSLELGSPSGEYGIKAFFKINIFSKQCIETKTVLVKTRF